MLCWDHLRLLLNYNGNLLWRRLSLVLVIELTVPLAHADTDGNVEGNDNGKKKVDDENPVGFILLALVEAAIEVFILQITAVVLAGDFVYADTPGHKISSSDHDDDPDKL